MSDGIDDADPMREEYRTRRDIFCNALTELGFKIAEPNGAFYIFAKIPDGSNQDSMAFALDLAKKAQVAVVPGIAFGTAGEGYIRLSYAASIEMIEKAIERISGYIKGGVTHEQSRIQ